jgi:hypothetical protein
MSTDKVDIGDVDPKRDDRLKIADDVHWSLAASVKSYFYARDLSR